MMNYMQEEQFHPRLDQSQYPQVGEATDQQYTHLEVR